jgi:hypothetical protein
VATGTPLRGHLTVDLNLFGDAAFLTPRLTTIGAVNNAIPGSHVLTLTAFGSDTIRLAGKLGSASPADGVDFVIQGNNGAFHLTEDGYLGSKFDLNGRSIRADVRARVAIDVDPGSGTIEQPIGGEITINHGRKGAAWGDGLTLGSAGQIGAVVDETAGSTSLVNQIEAAIKVGPDKPMFLVAKRGLDDARSGVAYFSNVQLGDNAQLTLGSEGQRLRIGRVTAGAGASIVTSRSNTSEPAPPYTIEELQMEPGGLGTVTVGSQSELSVGRINASGLTLQGPNGRLSMRPGSGVSVIDSLSIAGTPGAPTATLDLSDNAVVMDYTGTSPAATVRQQIVAGRGGAGLGKRWNGMGITSSAAAVANTNDPESRSVGYAENAAMPLGSLTMFRGHPVDDTSILMAFTRTGDANLDGVVNDDDVTIVGAMYAPGAPQPFWALGDFDYNGFVDDDDVTLLGAFYDPAAAPLASPAPQSASVVAAVPEPSTVLLLMVIAAVGGLRWASRRGALMNSD